MEEGAGDRVVECVAYLVHVPRQCRRLALAGSIRLVPACDTAIAGKEVERRHPEPKRHRKVEHRVPPKLFTVHQLRHLCRVV